MISQEDYLFIVGFDTNDSAAKDAKLKENPGQAAKTFLNLLGHVSKDQTIQYILVMIDDMLQVNEKSSVPGDRIGFYFEMSKLNFPSPGSCNLLKNGRNSKKHEN